MKWRGLGLLTTAVVLSGCGAQEADVLNGAFDDQITSANVEMKYTISSGAEPVRMGVAGPYRSNGPGKLPSVDWQMQMTPGDQALSNSRLVSSPEKAFVVYKGDAYEVPESDLASFRKPGRSQLDVSGMRDWLSQTHTTDDASLDGEPVTRITGRFDPVAAAKDLKALSVEQNPLFLFAALPGALLEEAGKTSADPRVTVDVARSDGKLRRVEATLRVKQDGQTATVNLTVRLKDVNKPVSIEVPASGKPFVELGRRTVTESPVGELYGDGGPDGKLRVTVGVARGQLAKETERWTAAMEELEASENYEKGATESRRFADVITGARGAIADEPGKSAALKRDRAELLAAMEGFQRALRTYADEIETRDDPDALEAAAAALERTGQRYDKAFARFD